MPFIKLVLKAAQMQCKLANQLKHHTASCLLVESLAIGDSTGLSMYGSRTFHLWGQSFL